MNKLKNCKVCNSPVAKSAKVCPMCGVKRPVKMSAGQRAIVAIGAVLFVLVLIVAIVGTSGSPDTTDGTVTDQPASNTLNTAENTPATNQPQPSVITKTIGDWTVVLNDFEFVESISGGLLYSFTPESGCRYAVCSLSVTNNGKEADAFLPIVYLPDDVSVKLIFGEYEYTRTSLIGYDDDLEYGAINPLVTVSGDLVFEVPEAVYNSVEPLILRFVCSGSAYDYVLR